MLDQALAREIARREGARLVLIPAIESAGAGFEISDGFVDPLTGELLSLSAVRAATRADVIDALDRLVRALRRDAGESMLSVARHSVRLPRVTTPSLDALERYAAGNDAFTRGRLEEAAQRWDEAVAIDSTFVSAHASLGFLHRRAQPTSG